MLSFVLPRSQVIAVALGVIPVLGFIHGTVVGSFRKAAGVPYPHSYATVEQTKSNVRPPKRDPQIISRTN
jgi:glutathione S-transferase